VEPHGLTEEAVAPMREQLAKMERVEAAYLVRKRVQLLPERACFVLGILPHMKRLQFWSETQDEELQKQVLAALEFPGETAVVILSEQGKAFQGPLSGVAGSEIYRRGK
ncbi:MAG TPA: hypothetical protein VK689_09170, partial [Armatimonadota bacterium]|nr:hypothetical protein [Armatimonadota bacterium]